MARGPISSLFYLCTRKKRYFSRFKALLINQSLISSSNSQFYDPFRPFSTHLVNPRFVPGLSQSLNLSGCRNLSMRPFSTDGEEGGEETSLHSELKTGVGENVDFELGNEVSDDVYALSENGVVLDNGNDECNSEIVDSVECSNSNSNSGESWRRLANFTVYIGCRTCVKKLPYGLWPF
jgi:hypothetical protein